MNQKEIKCLAIIIFTLCGLAGLHAQTSLNVKDKSGTPATAQLKQDNSAQLKLPNGWSLSPVGNQIPVGDLPLNIAVSPDQKYAAVTNNGESEQSIQLIDLHEQKLLDTYVIGKSWLGLVFG